MTQRGGDTLASTVVEGHHAAVGERQLEGSLTLLAGYLARHRAVYLVGEPVFAGHSLYLEHAVQVLVYLVLCIGHILIVAHHGVVAHHGLGRVAEHMCHIEVERLLAVSLHEGEVGVARGLADHVERGTLALGYLAHVVQMLLVDKQAHALLALVGDNLLGAQRLVADGQAGHVDTAATLLHQLGEAVEMACRTVVVDAHHGVGILLYQCAHQIVGTLLHLGVGTLHGVELYAVRVAACIYRRYRATAQTDAVVVATYHHDLVAFLRLLLQAVALLAVAHASSEHDDLVVAQLLVALIVLESEQRTGDERLAKLVSEVAGTIGCLDEDLLRSLIEPLAYRQQVFPVALGVALAGIVFQTGIGCHIDSRACDGP